MAKKKAARSKAGMGKSQGVVFDFENFDVEMVFEDLPAPESTRSRPGAGAEDTHKSPKPSNDPPNMNNSG